MMMIHPVMTTLTLWMLDVEEEVVDVTTTSRRSLDALLTLE